MRNREFNKYVKDTFVFDRNKELKIYKALCREKISKRSVKILKKDDKYFFRYKDWEKYIVDRYKNYGFDELNEFEKMLNLLINRVKPLNEFNKLVVAAYLSSSMASIVGAYEGFSNPFSMIGGSMLLIPMLVVIFIKLYDIINSDNSYIMMYEDIKNIVVKLKEEKVGDCKA